MLTLTKLEYTSNLLIYTCTLNIKSLLITNSYWIHVFIPRLFLSEKAVAAASESPCIAFPHTNGMADKAAWTQDFHDGPLIIRRSCGCSLLRNLCKSRVAPDRSGYAQEQHHQWNDNCTWNFVKSFEKVIQHERNWEQITDFFFQLTLQHVKKLAPVNTEEKVLGFILARQSELLE